MVQFNVCKYTNLYINCINHNGRYIHYINLLGSINEKLCQHSTKTENTQSFNNISYICVLPSQANYCLKLSEPPFYKMQHFCSTLPLLQINAVFVLAAW